MRSRYCSCSAIARTRDLALAARERIRRHPAVEEVHWFIGASAPSFFYNMVAELENDPAYAQGLVQLKGNQQVRGTIRSGSPPSWASWG